MKMSISKNHVQIMNGCFVMFQSLFAKLGVHIMSMQDDAHHLRVGPTAFQPEVLISQIQISSV